MSESVGKSLRKLKLLLELRLIKLPPPHRIREGEPESYPAPPPHHQADMETRPPPPPHHSVFHSTYLHADRQRQAGNRRAGGGEGEGGGYREWGPTSEI